MGFFGRLAKPKALDRSCPCGLPFPLASCCAPIIAGLAIAKTAEQLMRSRYSAYTLKNEAYLLESWHSTTRPKHLSFDDNQRWLGLKIVATEKGSEQDDEGVVQFVARYKLAGRGYRLKEKSRFSRENLRWAYLNGLVE